MSYVFFFFFGFLASRVRFFHVMLFSFCLYVVAFSFFYISFSRGCVFSLLVGALN